MSEVKTQPRTVSELACAIIDRFQQETGIQVTEDRIYDQEHMLVAFALRHFREELKQPDIGNEIFREGLFYVIKAEAYDR